MRAPRITILALAVGSLATWAGAGEPALGLEDAVRLALENNPAVHAAAARAQAAGERTKQAGGFRFPRIDLMEVYNYSNNPAETFALKLNQGRFDFGDFVATDPNDPEPLTTWITRIELEQPVYTGGKLSARIGQSRAMLGAEELNLAHVREQVAFDTVTAYTNLAKAREFLGLLRTARETTAAHVELAEKYAAEGFIVDAEVLKAKVYLAHMDELVEQAENGARLAEAALNFQMGTNQTTHREIERIPPPPAVNGDVDLWIADALAERRDLGSARRKLEAGRLEEKVATSGYLPEVGVLARYEWYDRTPFGNNNNSGSVMAVARINLLRGGSDKAARAAARYQTASFESDIRRFEEGVRLQVQQAWQDLQTARARHATAAAALEAAEESLRVREERFRQGLDKMIDLLDAETQLREARVRELVARYDIALATYRLYFSSGKSLIDTILPSEEIQ